MIQLQGFLQSIESLFGNLFQHPDWRNVVDVLILTVLIYQIIKQIGSMAAILKGDVDGILLGGGIVHNKDLVKKITEAVSFIAPVTAYPGEFEMEAMASGAARVLDGEEELKEYTGKLNWDKADFMA